MLKIDSVSRSFGDAKSGLVQALDGVSFEMVPGQTIGLLGMNGAGKSTLQRILATTLKASSGIIKLNDLQYKIDGESGENEDIRQSVGYLSGSTGLYKRLTGRETLKFFASMCGLSEDAIETAINGFVQKLKMEDFIDRYTEKYSTGQKQKVNICRALIHNPSLVILDEATTGLDPVARAQVTDFILKMRSPQNMMLYSTHYFDEADALCDKLLILHRGQKMFFGTKQEVLEQAQCKDLSQVFAQIAKDID